jgi:phosphotransferase system  glucose/maltose/N-acetylglucosamine-specific IIC component
MEQSPYEYSFPVWAIGCLAIVIAGTAAAIHFARGLWALLLSPSHRWELRADWTRCFLIALIWAAIYTSLLAWLARQKRLREAADLRAASGAAPVARKGTDGGRFGTR